MKINITSRIKIGMKDKRLKKKTMVIQMKRNTKNNEKALLEAGGKTCVPWGPALSGRLNRKHVKHPLKP